MFLWHMPDDYFTKNDMISVTELRFISKNIQKSQQYFLRGQRVTTPRLEQEPLMSDNIGINI